MSRSTRSRWAKAAGLLGAGAVAGIIGATAYSAGAENSAAPSPSSSASAAPSAPAGRGDHDGDHGGHAGENSVTSAQEATLRAAALKQVPGGTVDRVETDSGDAAYEVHMTDASGKQVTVKFDKNLKFVAVEDGMGK
jgi:Spy/CpxP family protein refolding chaperone